MNSYYIHNGTESTGPFDFDELKAKMIAKTTPVWCAGMEDWKYAGEITELQPLFVIVPPLINNFVTPTTQTEIGSLEETETTEPTANSKILGINKTFFYVLIALVTLFIASSVFTYFENKRSAELEQKNTRTEKENLQFQLQEKTIKEQKNQIIEQEKIAFEKVLKERKATLNSRLVEVQEKLFKSVSALEQAKNKLNKAQDFQFLRCATQREQEINSSQKEIDSLDNEVVELKKEMDHISLELEKIKI
ncbi:GYF domain-containing protein [Flavobacterium sp. I-SCBP12n]|uniref:GYF domain-containing protein n=2 Tax=Flavobacterium pygoscelis TaxID=2893176 RepID=A0A9X1XW47_9FLAO|nr:GYF domain-containing protein [Flavobacterium pygoscelis]MCK8142756.1 GYF domain-containing protein [Flavobacterium pygoscelis]